MPRQPSVRALLKLLRSSFARPAKSAPENSAAISQRLERLGCASLCSTPAFSRARWLSLDRRARALGLKIEPGSGTRNNLLVICEGARPCPALSIELDDGAKDNIVVLGAGTAVQGRLHLQSSNGLVVFGEQIEWLCKIDLRLSSKDESLIWGKMATSNGLRIVIEGEGKSVTIGDDCMFANETHISTSDLHGIADLETNAWLNPPSDVTVGRHVWVGQGAILSKGVSIGDGSIIGARALVTKDQPGNAISVGVPARVVKQGVRWVRERSPGGNSSD